MTDLDVLNELLKASPAVRRAMKAYLHKAFQRGQRYGERTAREMFDELLHRVHTVSHLNGATEIFKAAWDESKHPRGQPENAGEFAPAEGGESNRSSESNGQTQLPQPNGREGRRKIVESLRRAMWRTSRGKPEGQCIAAANVLRAVYPDTEIWYGYYENDEFKAHTIAKLGGKFIDVTADQFGGPKIRIWSELPEEYRNGKGDLVFQLDNQPPKPESNFHSSEKNMLAEFRKELSQHSTITKAFDESKHPRDHGRFSSAPGSDDGKSEPAPNKANRIEHPTDKHARTLAERIRSVPKRIRVKVAYLVRKKYEGLVEKFGKNGARAIIGASLFMLPVPLPGASMIPIALAHAVLKIRNLVSGPSLALVKAVGPEPTRDELERAAREFIEGIYRDMGEEPPEIPEELDLDDAGEPEAEEIDIPDSSSGASDESPDSDSRMTESGVTESDGDVSDAVALAMSSATQEIEPLLKARDSSGHEHRGKGPGGGQFTSGGDNGGGESTPAKSGDNRPPQAKDKSDNGERKVPQFASREEHAHAIRVALAKATAVPKPTKAEATIARRGIKAYGGANAYRKSFVGNSNDRAARRKKLQKEFGDGTKCPCVYCAILIGDAIGEGTLEQDKIYTTAEGGRYKISNLIPSCSDCNKVRSDKPFSEFIKGIKPNGKSPT